VGDEEDTRVFAAVSTSMTREASRRVEGRELGGVMLVAEVLMPAAGVAADADAASSSSRCGSPSVASFSAFLKYSVGWLLSVGSMYLRYDTPSSCLRNWSVSSSEMYVGAPVVGSSPNYTDFDPNQFFNV
jgi:hypothetical protein